MKALFALILLWVSIGVSCAQEFTLLFAGDAMLHQSQIDNAFRDGQYDYSSYFPYIQYEASSADLAIVNLEVTLGGKPYKGYPRFSAPDEYAFALKDAGFDVFLTANNHIVDRGNAGLIRTLSVLDSIGVQHTGVFRNKEERETKYPLFIEKNGIRFALLNCTYATNGLFAAAPVVVNYIDKDQIKKDIEKAREGKADIIIANMHWGEEYKLVQNKTQENLANFLVEEGVDLIIGSHPHVVQPSKTILDEAGNIKHVIVYSLGNLISGMLAVNTDGGQMIKVILEKNENGVSIKSAGYMLVYRHKWKEGNKTNYQVVPVSLVEDVVYPVVGEDAIVLNKDACDKMKIFSRNARAIFDKHNVGIPEYRVRLKAPKGKENIKFTPSFFDN